MELAPCVASFVASNYSQCYFCPKYSKTMPEDNRNENKNGKKSGEFKVPPRTYILWIAILGAIPLLMFFRNNATSTADTIPQAQFEQLVDSNSIIKGIIILGPTATTFKVVDVSGRYLKTDPDGKSVDTPFKSKVLLYISLEEQ